MLSLMWRVIPTVACDYNILGMIDGFIFKNNYDTYKLPVFGVIP